MKQSEYPPEILERLVLGKAPSKGPNEENPVLNETMPLDLLEVKHELKPCEDCSQAVINRHINIRRYQVPQAHWRQQCSECSKYKDPVSGEFTLNQYEIAAHYAEIKRQEKLTKQEAKIQSATCPKRPYGGRPKGSKNKVLDNK